MVDIPPTREAAQEHIENIRIEKGLHGPNCNLADLESALIILAEQLYQKSTHFLLELLQNIDDNIYETTSPTVNIDFKRRTLQIASNEIGFSKRNVDAICRIGRSTKSGLDHTTRYIGEKGIGFKSVFKVADIVWIHSGHYSFKFDKRQKLGMIAPIWADFPEKPLEGFTSILLQLSDKYDESELLHEIRFLEPKLLVFLRKLRQINISIVDDSSGYKWTKTLARHDELCDSIQQQQQFIKLQSDLSFQRYTITRFSVLGMPTESKRIGYNQTEILLGFPILEPNESVIEPQHVYAFLPIRDYGFKFLLQADFLLTASREDIDASSPWNQTLMESVPFAFLEAISQFNSNNSDLKYSWLRYLPIRQSLSDFFGNLEKITLEILSAQPILESISGELALPCSMTYVPSSFRDRNAVPLTSCESTQRRYLSNKYASSDLPYLQLLGVNCLLTKDFLLDLKTLICVHESEFRQKSSEWHSQLALVLAPMLTNSFHNNTAKSTIISLPIVLLRNGQWVTPNVKNLFFPVSENLTIPPGLEIREIHPEASQGSRRHLLSLLGVKPFIVSKISDLIINMHSNPKFEPRRLSHNDLISHAKILYSAGWNNTSSIDSTLIRNIWFFSEFNEYHFGSKLYIDSTEQYSATGMFKSHRSAFPFLHRDYLIAFCDEKGSGVEWLIKNFKLQIFPRISSPLEGSKYSFSYDFQALIEEGLWKEILLLLRDNWQHYRQWIEASNTREEDLCYQYSRNSVKSEISSMQVSCVDGSVAQLNQTALPISGFSPEDSLSISFLNVPDPDDHRWMYLQRFGVMTNLDAKALIRHLQALKGKKIKIEKVARFYDQLEVLAEDELMFIRQSFTSQPLVYIPPANGQSLGNWVHLKDVVWDGPEFVLKTSCLKVFYPHQKDFFCNTLKLKDADIDTLVEEARHIAIFDDIKYIAKLFITLATQLQLQTVGKRAYVATVLLQNKIFPVRITKSEDVFEYLSQAQITDRWYIADREYLKDCFDGLVPLLAFGVGDTKKMGQLFKILNFERRLLSVVAKGIPKAQGTVEIHLEYTKLLRHKAKFLVLLIPEELRDREAVVEQVQRVQVFQTEKIEVKWLLESPQGGITHGRAESGRVQLSSDKENHKLQIFMTKLDIEASSPPIELGEELFKFCEITNPDYIGILQYILTQSSLENIADALQRRGILHDVSNIKDDVLDPEMSEIDTSPNVETMDNEESGQQYGVTPIKSQQHVLDTLIPEHIGHRDLSTSLQAFIKDLEDASTPLSSQRWDSTKSLDLSSLLHKICKIEQQDPSLFLPQNTVSFNQYLGKNNDEPKYTFSAALPESYRFLRSDQIFPAYYRVSRNGASEVIVCVKDRIEVDIETIFLGEFYISRLFEKHLGSEYLPYSHWTSKLRNRAGYEPYSGKIEDVSTFTITDSTGSFTKFLLKNGHKKAAFWRKNLTFHIEVVTSINGLGSPCPVRASQIQKAEKLTIPKNLRYSPIEVFILIRVFNIREKPSIAIFIDPWQLHLMGHFSFQTDAHYLASLNNNSPGIYLQDLEEDSNLRKRGIFRRMFRSRDSSRVRPFIDGSYWYSPLTNAREIRLLELSPGEGDMPLRGTMLHCSLDNPGQYKAISYVWGAGLKHFQLTTPHGTLAITSSLYAAIRRVRDKQAKILIWADAICINQNNNHEKAIQIRLMRTIFNSAQSVIAWIGDENDESSCAIETLMQIRTQALKPQIWPDMLPKIHSSWAERKIPSQEDPIWHAIGLLFRRDWFHRVWIIQELVSASKAILICGPWITDWDDIFEAIRICKEAISAEASSSSFKDQILRQIDAAYDLGQTRKMFNGLLLKRQHSLLSLFELFSHTKATRECDKLFALIGLASDAEDDDFHPDYDSKFETIVRRYARAFIRRGETMEFLCRAGITKSYNFSSWIPYWTREDFPQTISTWYGAEGRFSASGLSSTSARLLPSDDTLLLVSGMKLDRITRIGTLTTQNKDVVSFVNYLCAEIDSLREYPTGEAMEDVKLKLPIGNARYPHMENSRQLLSANVVSIDSSPQRQSEAFDTFDNMAKDTSVPSVQAMINFLKQQPDTKARMWNYWGTVSTFLKRIPQAVFCVTERGYAGLVPSGTKVDDVICIFYGGKAPFILRENKHLGSYKVIGECYIHGYLLS